MESYACPSLVDGKGQITKVGCGGNWLPALPEKCPGCGGRLVHTQSVRVVDLKAREG